MSTFGQTTDKKYLNKEASSCNRRSGTLKRYDLFLFKTNLKKNSKLLVPPFLKKKYLIELAESKFDIHLDL